MIVKLMLTVDQLAGLFDLPSWEELDDDNYLFSHYDYAYSQALEEGKTEEEAEKIAQKAEGEARDELYGKWHEGVTQAADRLFEVHGLELIPESDDRVPYKYSVEPKKSWRDAADKVLETINGVGYFHFNTLEEFLESGPYTPKEAVLLHTHYFVRYPEVYGPGWDAESIYEMYLR